MWKIPVPLRCLGPVTGNPTNLGKVEDGPWFLSVWINNWRLLAWRDAFGAMKKPWFVGLLRGLYYKIIWGVQQSTIKIRINQSVLSLSRTENGKMGFEYCWFELYTFCHPKIVWLTMILGVRTCAESLIVPNALGNSEFNWRSFQKMNLPLIVQMGPYALVINGVTTLTYNSSSLISLPMSGEVTL